MASAFFREQFGRPPEHHPLVDADRDGHTKREFDRLSAPTSNPMWAVTRAAMKSVGRRSRGIQIGWEQGFDSGVMLDHVYENQPAGTDALGRFIDKQYLNSIGWRGIRQRKVHLMQRLRAALQHTHATGRPVRLLDIAAGPGRYVLETLKELHDVPVTATLRDYKEANLTAGRELAGNLKLTNVTFVQGDAFDRDGLAALTPKPTVAIVSGLYELFPENAPVKRSLAGLADALDPGCLLLYTNQPWHPQVEFIARVLTNREGQPWVMRRRTQLEMDDLVREAGFEKVAMDADPWGIFTVSVAVRRG
jgi:SAM-dependent methyltransferase